LKDSRNAAEDIEKFARYLLKNSKRPVSVRATITCENLKLMNLFDYFKQIGFRYMSFMPALGLQSEYWTLKSTHWTRYFDEFKSVVDEVLNLASLGNYIHVRPIDNLLEKIHFRIATGNCGALEEALAISPDGQVYPCSRFVSEQNFKCCDVGDPWMINQKSILRSKSTLTQPACRECWARYYCEGGCPFYNFMELNDFCQPTTDFCQHHRQFTDLALLTYARLCDKPDMLAGYFGKPDPKSSQTGSLYLSEPTKEVIQA
jgi:uncharacterized protein